MVVTRIGIVIGKMMTERGTIAIVVTVKTTHRTTKIRTVIVKGAGVTEMRKSTTPSQGILTTTIIIIATTGSASLFLKLNKQAQNNTYSHRWLLLLKGLKRYIEYFQYEGFLIGFISNVKIHHRHGLSGLAGHFGYLKRNKIQFGLNDISWYWLLSHCDW